MTEYFSVSEPKNSPIDDIYVVRNPILGLLNCEKFCRGIRPGPFSLPEQFVGQCLSGEMNSRPNIPTTTTRPNNPRKKIFFRKSDMLKLD